MLSQKKVIAILFFSAMFLCSNAEVTKACVNPSDRTILLEQPPTRFHNATFMGKVEITRSTTLTDMTLVRGIIEESSTHPHLVTEKITFVHEGKLFENLCPMDIRAGYKGYVIGREMQLNTDALIVDPYTADNFGAPIDINEGTIDTGKNEFPLRDFYEPGIEYFY